MPTVTLSKSVFEKLVGKKLPLSELKERISYLGTDLEKIDGDEIHVEIFPNRPDMLSEQGFARAFSSFIGIKKGLRKYNVKKTNMQLIVKNLPKEWPYAIACVIKGLKLTDEKVREIIQLQEKLGTTLTRNRSKGGIGLYPVEKVKFPITFCGKKPEDIRFRPLEFPKEINARQILSMHPKGRDYGHLMENWKTYPVFIDANGVFMSMPPIINSHEVGKIDENTTDLFLECTGPDLNTIHKSLNIMVTSLADMGGEIHGLEVVYPEKKMKFICPDLTPKKMKLDLDYVNKRLGLDLKEKDAKDLLERMGFDYEKGNVLVPAYRNDILHQVDFVEDIAIAYGYENFEPVMEPVATTGEEDPFQKFKRRVSYLLIGLSLMEVKTYHLLNMEDLTTKMNSTSVGGLEIANPTSAEFNTLRSWIIPSLMDVLNRNKHNEYPQNIFDIGKCFKENSKTETNTEEFTRLGVMLCDAETDFTKAKQILDYLFRMLELEYKVEDTECSSFIPGRVGRVSVNGKKVAYIGEINPIVLDNWEIDMPVSGFELNLTDIFEIINKK